MRDNNQRTVKIELLSQWKLEAEFRKYKYKHKHKEREERLKLEKEGQHQTHLSYCLLSWKYQKEGQHQAQSFILSWSIIMDPGSYIQHTLNIIF